MENNSKKSMPPMRGKDRNRGRDGCSQPGQQQGQGISKKHYAPADKPGLLAKWFGVQPGETAMDIFSSSSTDKLVNKGLRLASGLGQRILVHGLSMVAGASLATSYASGPLDVSGLAFSIYMGIICLFPRGDARQSDWFMPVLTGLAAAVVAMVLGSSWPFTIFLGGATTWALRVLCKKGRMGWEWLALPFLGVGYACYPYPWALPVWLVPAAVGAGYVGYLSVNRLVMTPMRRRIMARQARRLEDMAAHEALPAPLQKPMLNLATQATLASSRLEHLDNKLLPVLTALRIVNNRLSALLVMEAPRWDMEGERLVTALGNIYEELVAQLTVGPLLPESEALAVGEEDTEEGGSTAAQALDRQIKAITRKKRSLPDHLGVKIDALRTSTRGILEAMEGDTYLFTNGEKFLSRYLPMVNKIVDRYIALSEQSPQEEHVGKTMARCEEILSRLVEAFAREQSRLVRNDTMDFNAELTALEALMRMDGK